MAARRGITLGHVFTLGGVGLLALLVLLFWVVLQRSLEAAMEVAESRRDEVARQIEHEIDEFLDGARAALDNFESGLSHALFDAQDDEAVEAALLAQALSNPDLAELTLTRARLSGHDAAGLPVLESEGRGQVSVFRPRAPAGNLDTRRTVSMDGGFRAETRVRKEGESLRARAFEPEPESVPDPASHLTFITPARSDFYGEALWSDLHWTQLDEALPRDERRVVVSLQKTVEDAEGAFVGVLRVGMVADRLDELVRSRLPDDDPHRIFLCDPEGRLVTRPTPEDRHAEDGYDLRVAPRELPPDVAGALARLVEYPERGSTVTSGRCKAAGVDLLYTFRPLTRSQDWLVGIVAPQSFYLADLERTRMALLVTTLIVMTVILIANVVMLRTIRRGIGQITSRTEDLERFHFEARDTQTTFADLTNVLERLEVAKTAMRAMGHYVAVDLVKKLFTEKREPTLGSESRDVSLMFTDIADFTSLSERVSPDELAQLLGRYLAVMTEAIQATNGVIDKFIGDAVMAMWNAPAPFADHPAHACEAALVCVERTEALFASEEWAGRAPLFTRFGLHTGTVLVGHFGAPTRMNYTALGDGVNLAARLESINKFYGTRIVASQAIVDCAGDSFEFRLLDCVAVKGKREGVRIYELLGRKGEALELDCARLYEAAFAAHLERDFEGALEVLAKQIDDPPSAVLHARCERYRSEPPPPEWEGVFVHTAK